MEGSAFKDVDIIEERLGISSKKIEQERKNRDNDTKKAHQTLTNI